ncbi:MAG: TetR/AcrR family transcriptional regulator [Mariniphaga sp.]
MPRSQEQNNEIRKQKKQLIMDTALELFAENGFHATSMSQVAKKAGVSKGLAYNYFESKQEILDEIIKTGFDFIYSHFDLNHDGILTEEEFRYFIRKTFQMIFENKTFWRLFMALMLQEGPADSAMKKYTIKNEKIISMLNQFIASKGNKNPADDFLSIAFLLKGAFIVAITNPEVLKSENITDKITEACFRLISTK